jgi:hypothetical protein
MHEHPRDTSCSQFCKHHTRTTGTAEGEVKLSPCQHQEGRWWRVQIRCNSILTSAPDAGERSASRPGRFTPGKEHRSSWRLGGAQSRSGRFGREKNLLSLTGFVPPIVQTVAKVENTFTNTRLHRIKWTLPPHYAFIVCTSYKDSTSSPQNTEIKHIGPQQDNKNSVDVLFCPVLPEIRQRIALPVARLSHLCSSSGIRTSVMGKS